MAWPPSIFGTTKTRAFPTNVQSRFASVVPDNVLGQFPLYPFVSKVMHRVSRGPLILTAQKAPQGSKKETWEFLGGTEENTVSPTRVH